MYHRVVRQRRHHRAQGSLRRQGGDCSHRKTFWINVQSSWVEAQFPRDEHRISRWWDRNNWYQQLFQRSHWRFLKRRTRHCRDKCDSGGTGYFNTTRKNTPLSVELADIFQSTVAKLLWASKRSRLDLTFAVAFLCSRLNCATEGDWEKLRRVLGYLKGAIHMKRKLSASNLHTMYTWVDASYAVHPDMRSHTGRALSLGVGALNVMLRKLRLNSKVRPKPK